MNKWDKFINATNIAMGLNPYWEDNDSSAGEDTFPPLVEPKVSSNYLQKHATVH